MPTKDLKTKQPTAGKSATLLESVCAKIRPAAELMHHGMMVTSLDYKVAYANTTARSLLGEELSGQDLITLLAESAKEKPEIIRKGLVRQGDSSYIAHLQNRAVEIIRQACIEDGEMAGYLMLVRDVTALSWVKERLAAVISNFNDGFVVIDRTDTVLDHNREWLELFGIDQPIVGLKMAEVLKAQPPLEFDRDPADVFKQVMQGKKILVYCFATKTNRHIQFSCGPLKVEGKVTGMIATGRDITALVEKTVEANALAMEEQKNARKLNELTDLSAIFSLRPEQLYKKFTTHLSTLLESPYTSIYLYSPRQKKLARMATSTNFNEHPDEVSPTKKDLVGRVFLTRKAEINNLGEGEPKSVFAHYSISVPITIHSKVMGCILATRQDKPYTKSDLNFLKIAAMRKGILIENANLYQEVNARRERWEAVFKFTEDGIVIYDHEGRIVGFNATCAGLTQYSVTEAIGQPFTKIIRTVSPEGIDLSGRSPIKQVLSGGKTIPKTEQLIEGKAGNRFWAQISYSPMLDHDGNVTSGIAVIRNIQRDREIEEIKSDFISIVSHELRTPLSAIKGFMSMLLKKDFGDLTDKQFHYLSRVYQSNQRMIDLVEDLLDISHIEGGKINLDLRPLAMENIIRDVVTELAGKGFERDITLKVNRRYRLPLVLADESRLRQILTNLVDNGIKYSMPKSEVTIDFKIHGDELITSITDKGVGITPSQIGKLFQKFGRVFNPMTVQAGGTGLGLYIVKNLVEAHGGRIWVTSRESAGSKFSFSLPIAKQLTLLN